MMKALRKFVMKACSGPPSSYEMYCNVRVITLVLSVIFFFFSLSLQTLLETKCVSEVLTQLDEQRKRGRTLTQADIVSSLL